MKRGVKIVSKIPLLIILTVGLLMAGCSSTSTPTPTPTPVPGTRVGNLAPDFQFQNLEGQTTSLSDLQGKPVLINFWQTQCAACVYEMPYIQQVYDEWSDKGLVVLVVNMGESPSKVGEFLQRYGFSFPVLLDTKAEIAIRYNIIYIPVTFLIDKEGIIQATKVGPFLSKEEIEKMLSKVFQ